MLSTAENRSARQLAASMLPVEFLVSMAQSAIKANATGRQWRILPQDVGRLVEAHGVRDARWFASEIIVWHRGWGLAELSRIATARGIEH